MPNPLSRSLFEAIPADLPEERFDDWLQTPGFRLERILSRGHVTPEGEWYDQVQNE